MTYLKTLIALTGLALLTACGGSATPKTDDNGDNNTTALTCTQNPFGTTCTAPTPTEAEVFCRDASKPTTTKANDCAPTVMRVCDDDPYDAGLCIDNNDYTNARQLIRLTCANTDDDLRDSLCPMAVATECTADPFLAVCRLGTDGAEVGTYGQARATQILATCAGENGEGFGNVFDPKCSDVEPYQTEKDRITNECENGGGNTNTCPADVVMQVCLGNPYNTILCFEQDGIDYSTQRMERLEACKGNNTLAGCAAAAETTCPANPFQAGICFISTTYMSQRNSETQNCRNKVADAPNCVPAQTAACTLDKFDSICMGVTLFIDAQRNECALATATTAQCNMVFAAPLAGCLADPFSDTCDAEPTFTASKVAVRTSRFGFCKADQTNDVRCTGYRTCDNDLVFAPLTSCGADFQPARITFCKVTANAFDAGCVDDLIDAAAQLAYCKLSTANLFGTDCAKDAFTQARIEFCEATPDTDGCRADLRDEMLMSVTDPCAGGVCVDLADLPDTILTTPTIKYVQESDGNGGMQDTTTETDDFADGFLKKVTLIAPANGVLLNPDGTDNTTIDPAPFNMGGITGVTVREGATRFRRRGGRGSSDADGFVIFNLLKANDDNSVIDSSRASAHAAILPTTNLGAPLTEAPTTAVWRGHYYNFTNIYSTDFYVTFDGTIGAIGFANPAKNAIGTGDNRPDFAKVSGIAMAVTFDAKGVLSGSLSSSFFSDSVLGLIGTEGAVGVVVGSEAGFTATNPDGGATEIVIDPCIGGLAACYGTHAFWVSNTRDSRNTRFLRVRPASEASPADDPKFSFVMGGATALDIPTFANTNGTNSESLTLSDLADSEDATSGFAFKYIITTITNYTYAGLLDGTNVGAPFTDANQPAAEWTAIAQMTNSMPTPPFTLDVVFTGGAGTIKTKAGESIMLPDGNDSAADDLITIDGQFGSNGVIYGNVVLNSNTSFVVNESLTLSGLIGANGAVGVFGGVSAFGSAFAGGFVARPTPASDN